LITAEQSNAVISRPTGGSQNPETLTQTIDYHVKFGRSKSNDM